MRNPGIDVLRFVLCLMVIIGHVFRCFDLQMDDFKVCRGCFKVINNVMLYGHAAGMNTFFVLAGCSLVWSMNTKRLVNLKAYFFKRFLRLLVPLLGGYVAFVIPTRFLLRDRVECGGEHGPENLFTFSWWYTKECKSLYWLWFLGILYIMTLIFVPLVALVWRVLFDRVTGSLRRSFFIQFVGYSIFMSVMFMLGLPVFASVAIILQYCLVFGLVLFKNRKHDSFSIILQFCGSLFLRILFHTSIDTPSALPKILYLLFGFSDLLCLGVKIAIILRIKPKFTYKVRVFLLLSVFFLLPIVFPLWDEDYESFTLLYGVYASFFDVDKRMRYAIFGQLISLLLFSMFYWGLSQRSHGETERFITRASLPMYVIHPFILVLVINLQRSGHWSNGVSLFVMSIWTVLFTLIASVFLDLVPYFRAIVGFSGKSWLRNMKEKHKFKDVYMNVEENSR
ncbi:hypothetical protein PCE1_002456 [Barthelona sp. PCE]